MYRIGKKQKRAILTSEGKEVVVFAVGQETLAEKVCNLLNADAKQQKEKQKQWVCNECNTPNFTQSVPKEEIEQELRSCINCGCFEFHLA